ncbi:MAG: hypothetical protein JZU70_11745 [Chlorobium sp.]|jgi:hypothetical protein|nr:hypothetical protein [Chlorobium sp.]
MNIQTIIDDNLISQASLLTGVSDSRNLLEYALRLLIQVKMADRTIPANNAYSDNGFFKELQRFRESVDLHQFTDADDIFNNIRDTSGGRDIQL